MLSKLFRNQYIQNTCSVTSYLTLVSHVGFPLIHNAWTLNKHNRFLRYKLCYSCPVPHCKNLIQHEPWPSLSISKQPARKTGRYINCSILGLFPGVSQSWHSVKTRQGSGCFSLIWSRRKIIILKGRYTEESNYLRKILWWHVLLVELQYARRMLLACCLSACVCARGGACVCVGMFFIPPWPHLPDKRQTDMCVRKTIEGG